MRKREDFLLTDPTASYSSIHTSVKTRREGRNKTIGNKKQQWAVGRVGVKGTMPRIGERKEKEERAANRTDWKCACMRGMYVHILCALHGVWFN